MSRRATTPSFSPLRLAVALSATFAAASFVEVPAAFGQAAPPAGGAPPPLHDPEPGWHVIRPGDTLEGLAKKYLGDARHWPEIHRLNPGIDDPHWIYPGRRMRVLVERPSAAPNAQVTALARRVESRPEPVPWQKTDEGDLLLERDGLRTFENSSARLLFDDGTTATVSEDSMVFIRRQTPARATAPKKEIEVVLGQADVEAKRHATLATPEIEVLVAGVKSTSRAGADGTVRGRARKVESSAQFMLYEGSGKVASGGGAVDLAAGTGTVVAPKTPPAPPEKLLPAPALLEPADADELGHDEPVVRWSAVAGARTYVVEVCADAQCGSVREKRTDLAATEARLAEPLAEGDSYWRVTAAAPSGLDGFPSAPRRFTAVDALRPPAPTVALFDAAGAPLAAGAVFASAPRVEVRAVDSSGNPLTWSLLLDGQASTADDLAAVRTSGPHEIVAVAKDARGREARSAPVAFALDLASPLIVAPATTQGQRAEEPKKSRSERSSDEPPPAAQPCAGGLEVSAGDAAWLPLACGDAAAAATELALSGKEQEIRLRASRGLVLGERRLVAGGNEATLVASDVGSGLARARLRVVPSSESDARGRSLLEVEVVDLAGGVSRASWHVEWQ